MLSVISHLALPVAVCLIVLSGLFRRVKVFDCFKEGALKGLSSAYGILPTIIGLVVSVTMLRASGATEIICNLFSPIADFLGVPREVMPVALLTPISGGGSLSMFEGLLENCGPDSFAGRVASVLMGATDTTFYAVSVYFAAVSVRNTRHTLLAGLSADFVSLVLSSFFVKLTL